ncbi:MAG: hypothetical protein P8Z50_02990, partial [candidate division WOR-3 bacterium]
LEVNEKILDWKSKDLEFKDILYKPEVPNNIGVFYSKPEKHDLDDILDIQLIDLAKNAILKEEKIKENVLIKNINRTVGARLSGEVCYVYGEKGLPDDTVHFKFKGFAGQSFGAFLAKGITFELEGMSNDYVGNGIFGGKIIIYPDKESSYNPEENIIIGNTGMSGGIAYVYDIDGDFKSKCNLEMIKLKEINEDDAKVIHNLINSHYKHTDSNRAKEILKNFAREIPKFIKVIPSEYEHILKTERKENLKQWVDSIVY